MVRTPPSSAAVPFIDYNSLWLKHSAKHLILSHGIYMGVLLLENAFFFFNCRRPCCCRPTGGRSPTTPKLGRGWWGALDSWQGPAWRVGSCMHLRAFLSSQAHQSIAGWSLLQSPCAHTPPGMGWSVGLVQILIHSTLRLHCIGFSATFPQPAPWGCLVLLFHIIPMLHRHVL